jgi:predicted RNA methylase
MIPAPHASKPMPTISNPIEDSGRSLSYTALSKTVSRMFGRIPSFLIILSAISWLAGCGDAGSSLSAGSSIQTPAVQPLTGSSGDRTSGVDPPTDTEWRWESAPDFDRDVAVFQSVFWEPKDTENLRALIRKSAVVEGKTVLEIGTGTGLIALCCLKAGAKRVVATDINPAAVANARYNAKLLGVADRLDVRRVPLDNAGAYSVIRPSEQFDLIISNPPWELTDRPPKRIAEFALFDPKFELMRTMLLGHKDRLRPNGKLLLVYGCVSAIKAVQETAKQQGLTTKILDDRRLDLLPELFLPGMLLELTP